MRPQILFSLFSPVERLAGIGPRLAKLVERLAGPKIVDLLWHLPSGIIDRRFAPKIAEAPAGRVATITVRIDHHAPPLAPNRPYKVRCNDETGTLDLIFFHVKGDYLKRLLPVGQKRVVSGKVEIFNGQPQMAHPDHIEVPEDRQRVETVEPVYPLTAGLQPRVLRTAIESAVAKAPKLPEWLDGPLKARRGWPDWPAALHAIHHPDDETSLQPEAPARERLAYDELLANQLALSLVRNRLRRSHGRDNCGDGRLRSQVLQALPFPLTRSQQEAIAEIDRDMGSERRMLRLLQGDVGSGKTVVALMAMLNAVESGRQAALMAPTEILSRQHLKTLERLGAAAGLRLAVLTGREKGKSRDTLLAALEAGEIDIVVGTHALFQETVRFRDLGMAVVDEQHRFGVHERLELAGKGQGVDVLVMTATPIPRTLTLTAFGDMDVTRLTEKPAGRSAIDTRVLPLDRLDEVVEGVERRTAAGDRAYWICPLVEESEQSDLAAARQRHAELRARFGERVGLVHGRMKGPEKDAVMAAFGAGEIQILIATTVVEVGVDVPEATLIVIEHAERFGLAQLHQLRGRVGRGSRPSACLLLYAGPLNDTARRRLQILRETEDGFLIAEEDLKLRGGGELLGTKQSGLPQFRLADLSAHADLLRIAHDDARLILDRDPELASERGQALRVLLYLFERDAAVRYLRSG